MTDRGPNEQEDDHLTEELQFADQAQERFRAYVKVSQEADYAKLVQRLGAEYLKEYSFTQGDLLQLKPGLRDSAMPDYGRPVVYIGEVAEEDRTESIGYPLVFLSALSSIYVGLIDGDYRFQIVRTDPRRFQPWSEATDRAGLD